MTPDETTTAFRGRPPRRSTPRWPLFVAPLGSATATVGALGMVAGAPVAATSVLIAAGVVAAVAGLVVAHR